MTTTIMTISKLILLFVVVNDGCYYSVEAIFFALRRGRKACQQFTTSHIIPSKSSSCNCFGFVNQFFAFCTFHNYTQCLDANHTLCQNENIGYVGSFNNRNRGFSQFVYTINEFTSPIVPNPPSLYTNSTNIQIKAIHNADFKVGNGIVKFVNCTAKIGSAYCQSCTICNTSSSLQFNFNCRNIPLSSSNYILPATEQCLGLL